MGALQEALNSFRYTAWGVVEMKELNYLVFNMVV